MVMLLLVYNETRHKKIVKVVDKKKKSLHTLSNYASIEGIHVIYNKSKSPTNIIVLVSHYYIHQLSNLLINSQVELKRLSVASKLNTKTHCPSFPF
jgi:hypothetical protein